MAGRWRSTQRRKRWTDHAAPLPEGALAALEARPALHPLAVQLVALGREPSTYAQLALVKKLGGSLLAALQPAGGGDEDARVGLRVYVELLFAENSRPLHRGLLSSLANVPPCHAEALRRVFRDCCQEYGTGGAKEGPFAVVAVSASLAALPQPGLMKEIARDCAPLMAECLCRDVRRVVRHALDGGRPTPAAMEECQDALSSIYYLLQQFPDEFYPQHSPYAISGDEQCLARRACGTEFSQCGKMLHSPSPDESPDTKNDSETNISERYKEGLVSKSFQGANTHFLGPDEERDSTDMRRDVYETIVSTLLDVLQTAVLSRDSLVAAGVGLAATAQLSATPEGLALLLAENSFNSSKYTYSVLSLGDGVGDAKGGRGILESVVMFRRKSTLGIELEKLSEFGKLCFFRGLLTAVPRNVQNVHLLRKSSMEQCHQHHQSVTEELQWQAWTLLYDGILPALCAFCERSVDSHFKFHAATAMQICLQQIKTSICGDLTTSAFKQFRLAVNRHSVSVSPYDPLPPGRIKQILKLIWNNWEDPLTQTVKQVQVVFDLLIDVQLVHDRDSYVDNLAEEENGVCLHPARKEMDGTGTQEFLQQVAADLLAAGSYRKGKYVPLASLVLRIGARKMLQMSPNLLFRTIDAFSDDDVCSSASNFMKTFLERLQEDCWSVDGIINGTMAARRSWLPPLLSGLLTGDARLRNNLTTYALPVAMHIDGDCLSLVLAYILDVHSNSDSLGESNLSWEELEGARGLPGNLTVNQRVVLLTSVLKVARSLALIEGSVDRVLNQKEMPDGSDICKEALGLAQAVLYVKSQAIKVPVRLLVLALTHREDGVRVDTAEFIGLNPKTASMPSPLELSMLRTALRLNMRCSSTAFRMRWTSFLKKFFLRVRTAVERQCKANIVRRSQSTHLKASTSFSESVSVKDVADKDVSSVEGFGSAVTVEQMQEFMQWLGQLLISSLYPSAPYERKSMAMEVLHALLEVWSLEEFWKKRSGRYTSSPYLDNLDFSPYHHSLLSVDFTLVVVGAIVDSWDRLREGAYRLLVRYPTPLPGLESESSLVGLLKWATSLVNSPRVRECDAGALAFRLIFRKYVVDLGWSVVIHPEPKVAMKFKEGPDSNSDPRIGITVVKFLASLCDWLQWGIEEGDKDLLKACSHSFVHGVLLVLRYTVEEMDWTSAGVQLSSANLHDTLARLLSLLLRVTSLALWVVSADALNMQENLSVPSPHGSMVFENSSTRSAFVAANYGSLEDDYESDSEETLAPPEQMVMVGCWLSVKEASLLLGTIARVVPLSGSPLSRSNIRRVEEESLQLMSPVIASKSSSILDNKQLEEIGAHFVRVLLSMKHNGAIDKARTGFTALCDRLLRSNDIRLNQLPEIWLREVMDHTAARGQVVDNLLRRSAGIPPAFLALFHAEPDGSPKKLLPFAMGWLMNTCKRFVGESSSQSQDEHKVEGSNQGDDYKMTKEVILPFHSKPEDGFGRMGEKRAPAAFKSRDEGVVPTVHAFNTLRMVFHDTNLATDTSGFCAQGLMTAIKAFASSHWEVRNSATLAFTALVHRTIGFLNVFKRESARRAITGFEFFHRYPALHPFLLQELRSATWQLEHGANHKDGNGLASLLHPSLAPVLIILSRLKPSFIGSDVEDWLNPSAFMPYVSKCATQKNLHIRVLASRGLAPLVPPERLSEVVLQLAQSLPLSSATPKFDTMNVPQTFSPDQTNGFTDGSHLMGPRKVSGFNAIHGVLLQLCTLLTSNCTSLPDVDQKSRIVRQVSLAVEERLWLGSRKLCGCCVVVGSFLELLSCLLSLGNLCQENATNSLTPTSRLQEILSELSSECLDDTSSNVSYDAQRNGLRTKAAELYFRMKLTRGLSESTSQNSNLGFGLKYNKDAGIVLRPSATVGGKLGLPFKDINTSRHFGSEGNGPFAARLRQALVDSSYEVRLATLKVLKKYYGLLRSVPSQTYKTFHEVDLQADDFIFLRPLIVERLTLEAHPFCTYRILQVIYAWTVIDRDDQRTVFREWENQASLWTDPNSMWGSRLSAQELWCRLLKIYNTSKQLKTKEVAVRCLGGSLQKIRPIVAKKIKSGDSISSSTSRSPKDCCREEIGNGISESSLPSDVSFCATKGRIVYSVEEVFNIWLGISKAHSLASEPVNFRLATAEAIVASGILEDAKWIGLELGKALQKDGQAGECCDPLGVTAVEWYAKCVLCAWCICIKLLEDEDADLRQNLALSVLSEIAKSDPQTELPVPAQVEEVIQLSFAFLSTQFGRWTEYYNVLAGWVLGSEDGDDEIISGDVDLVRRLFDKEIDNHHEEELLFVQLCCVQLKQLQRLPLIKEASKENGEVQQVSALGDEQKICTAVTMSSWYDKPEVRESFPLSYEEDLPKAMVSASWYDQFSRTWRAKFLKRAMVCARASVNLKDSVQWVGGVTNHQDTFKRLYRSLLGLLSVMQSKETLPNGEVSLDEEEFVRGLAQVSLLLQQSPLNPLVSNALIQVLQTYESQLEVRLGSSEIRSQLGSAFCETFSPLFLIN